MKEQLLLKFFSVKSMLIMINLLIISNLTILNLNAQVRSDTIIYWDKNRKLEWANFLGKVPLDCGKDKARSYLSINSSFFIRENLLDVKVLCFFNKTRSWTKDVSLSLLDHEQLHFDIAELYARKIRKGISALRNAHQTKTEEYTKLVNNLIKEYKQLNVQYDTETEHGMYSFKQAEWKSKIGKELKENEKYQVNYPHD